MIPYLAITQGPDKGRVIPIEADSIRVGRDPGCEVLLADAQISRRHLRISGADDAWKITDLNSSNGTLLNGEQISSQALKDGDILILGETMMGFHFGEEVPPESSDFSGTDTQTITVNERGLYDHWEQEDDINDLRRARSDLESLYRVGRAIHSILNPAELAPAILKLVFQEMPRVDRASVYLIDEESGELTCSAFKVRKLRGQKEDVAVFSSTMAEQVMKDHAAMLTYDAMGDERFSAQASIHAQHIRSAICAPLMAAEKVIGLLFADSAKPATRFTVDDLRLLAAVGLQAGSAVENAILYERMAYGKAELHVANQKLKSAQDQLIQAEKLAAVGRLSAGIVHDMKNPMTVILGYTGMVRKRVGSFDTESEEQAINRLLDQIDDGVNHVNKVIEHLLIFAKPSELSKQETTVKTVIDDTMRFLMHEANGAGVKIRNEVPDTLPLVLIDANQIKQVFINIVINAIQSTELHRGELTLRAESVETEYGSRVAVEFIDNGCGMDEAQCTKVFEPFYTTKKSGKGLGGSGLGLSVSYGIIQSHGGTIEVESEQGVGSTFRVTLPVA